MGKVVLWVISLLLLIGLTVGVTLAIAQPLVLSPNQAPWWGIPIFTLAGGLGASLIAGFFLFANENRKREAELTQKDHEAQIKACVDFLGEVNAYYHSSEDFTETALASIASALFYVDVLAEPEVSGLARKLFDDVTSAKAASEAQALGYIGESESHLLRDWYDYSLTTYIDQLRKQYGLKALDRMTERPALEKPDLQAIVKDHMAAKQGADD